MVKYYINKNDNKVIKLTSDTCFFYYQIKRYGTGDIRHEYGRTTFPNPERLKEVLIDYEECTEEEFLTVVKDYYSKEVENATKFRKTVLGLN